MALLRLLETFVHTYIESRFLFVVEEADVGAQGEGEFAEGFDAQAAAVGNFVEAGGDTQGVAYVAGRAEHRRAEPLPIHPIFGLKNHHVAVYISVEHKAACGGLVSVGYARQFLKWYLAAHRRNGKEIKRKHVIDVVLRLRNMKIVPHV